VGCVLADQEHQNLRRIFELAIAASAEDREAILEFECRGDSALKERIRAMLAGAEDEQFLAEPTLDAAPTTDISPDAEANRRAADMAASLRERPGTRIGPYKLLQLIGEGGFGSVFLAEQEKPVARKVAFKIIKLGMDTRQVIARFEAERQALAMMDHPNIARVLDAGATDTGRPYFVMDLVKGDPIAEYCDKHNLGIEARLDLFAQVCLAVQHAHTKGIIHRDIKPSNVLVATVDGRPLAKVIDFGIAKATASKLTEKTLFTEHRQLIGTPEYMSPEQAEGSLDIDTRTDVYSLGVLLYELLTGTTPFDSRGLRSAAFAEIQRIIREVDPPKPSTRLSQATQTIASVAARRQTEPRKLNAVVRGDLDWIVMKALEKDRSRRYETANGFAMDIRRYLSGEAVVAAPPSSVYRVRKFVARHRGPVLAGSMVAIALVLGVVGTTVGLIDANRQRTVAELATKGESEQRRLAETRLGEAEATVAFLDDMLGAVDPGAQGKDVTVRAVLDEAAKALSKKFSDRPLVAARLHGTIGRTYIGLGVYPSAESHVRDALAMRQTLLGAEHADTCRALNELGAFLIKSGEHAEAERMLKQAIVDHARIFGKSHQITLQSMDNLATLYALQMRPKEASLLVSEVLRERTATLGKEDILTLASMNTLATLDVDLQEFDESERLFNEAIAVQDRVAGPEHPTTLDLRTNLAWMYYSAAMAEEQSHPELKAPRLEKARELGERTVEAKTRVLGPDHQDTLSSISNLASVHRALKNHVRADELSMRDLEACVRVLGENHPDTITSLANIGNSYRQRGMNAEALPYLERAIRGSRISLPPDSPGTAFALGWYGTALGGVGRYEEGEKALIEACGIMDRSFGPQHDISKQVFRSLGMFYEKWDKADPGKGRGDKAAAWNKKSGDLP
jgi:serine/threonine protein kinase/tetratricopeptide (TPR) repeat protein